MDEVILYKNFSKIIDEKLKNKLINKNFSEKSKDKQILDLFETKYLFENKKIKLIDKDNKKITKKKLDDHLLKNITNFKDKYLVFKEFKDNGYIIKDGVNYGFDFRIYRNTKKHTHTLYLVDVKRNYKDNLKEIIKSLRVAKSINADYIIALLNSENQIIKIKIDRINI